ncbi:MAG: hypothetical protein HON90_17170 [Halobacteriovoraceae bacterium]|jgi:50S ribosomal protein L16 3-hydroxylase|nr:hypothetical protein [Halobacteriovoraceae bacterium]
MNLFNQITVEHFLENYWEKEFYVFRNAIPEPEELIEIADVIEMGETEDYESRMIAKNNGEWNVSEGPYDFDQVKQDNEYWTLVVHNLELYLPKILALKKKLEFLPSWLFDDAMCTYSNQDSSVGAHIDNYNVFIAQLQGTRTWEVQHSPNPAYHEGLEVKLLKEFVPTQTIELNPGDIIYIPPHIAHHGISKTDSLSLSLGYKSLEDKKLMDALALETLNLFESDDLYHPHFSEKINDHLLISNKIVNDLKERLIAHIENEDFFKNFILKFNSTPKHTPEPCEIEYEEFQEMFKTSPLFKDDFIRFCAYKKSNDSFEVAINENIFNLKLEEYELIKKLYHMDYTDEILFDKFNLIVQTLYSLFVNGGVYFEVE